MTVILFMLQWLKLVAWGPSSVHYVILLTDRFVVYWLIDLYGSHIYGRHISHTDQSEASGSMLKSWFMKFSILCIAQKKIQYSCHTDKIASILRFTLFVFDLFSDVLSVKFCVNVPTSVVWLKTLIYLSYTWQGFKYLNSLNPGGSDYNFTCVGSYHILVIHIFRISYIFKIFSNL